MNIDGKTALVTGASRGIGRAIALELAQSGITRLVLVARDPQRLAAVAAEIVPLGVEVVSLPLDLTQSTQVDIAIAQIWRDHGPIHLLINCAGVAHQSLFLRTRPQQFQEELNVNLLSLYTITRLIARRMASRQEGVIVNLSSLMGKLAAPSLATYSATKFAILGFTQALRGELAPHHVKVMSLLPSLTLTDMVREMSWFRWVIPMTPEQVAKVLVRRLQVCPPERLPAEILVGWQSHLAVWGNRIAPWLVQKGLQLASPALKQSPPVQKKRSPIWAR